MMKFEVEVMIEKNSNLFLRIFPDMDLFGELEFNDDDLLDSVEDAEPRIIIEAFCVFNAAVVHIAYPTSQQGWVYRADL